MDNQKELTQEEFDKISQDVQNTFMDLQEQEDEAKKAANKKNTGFIGQFAQYYPNGFP